MHIQDLTCLQLNSIFSLPVVITSFKFFYLLYTEVGTGDKDGGYSQWSEWTECSKTCGGGIQERERTCTSPKPEGNGKNCDHLGPSMETRGCNIEGCKREYLIVYRPSTSQHTVI